MDLSPTIRIVTWIGYAFMAAMVVRAVFSWIEPIPRNRFHILAWRITEPVMAPVRRLVPPVGGLDISFIIVFFALSILLQLISQAG